MDKQVYAVLIESAEIWSTRDRDVVVTSSPLGVFWLEADKQPVPEQSSIIKVRRTNKRVRGITIPHFYYEIVP
jgi:hypothetical protein